MSAPIDIEALEASIAAHKALAERTQRIVDRILPELPSAHGFYQPHAFVAGSRRRGDRNYLAWLLYGLLRGKAEGHPPEIRMPKDSEHCLGGTAMDRASKALARDPKAALREAIAYVRAERAAA